MLRTTRHNTGATSRQIRAAQMGPPMHGPSLDGFGDAGICGTLPGSSTTSSTTRCTTTCSPSTFAAGVQDPIPAGGSASSDVVWQFGHFDALTLTEPSGSRLTGSSVAVPVTARNHGDALAGRTVRHTVTGANPTSGTLATSASGAATIAWTGTKAGTDRLHALIDDNGDGMEQPDGAADDISVTFDARASSLAPRPRPLWTSLRRPPW